MRDYFARETVEEYVARLAVDDGLSFRQITSNTIRKGQSFLFKNWPRNVTTVPSMISRFYQQLMESHKMEIAESKKFMKFAVVFDEWSSNNSKRYLNIALLGKEKFSNLGLIRICGSATSQNCLELVKSFLKTFDCGLDNEVVCIITDGCNVMKRIGDLIKPIKQQLCFAHAIQLAVLKSLLLLGRNCEEEERFMESDYENESEECTEDGGIFLTKEKRKKFH